jgi:hypothetical protein
MSNPGDSKAKEAAVKAAIVEAERVSSLLEKARTTYAVATNDQLAAAATAATALTAAIQRATDTD